MGWPKKDAEGRLYYERTSKSYIMVFHDLRDPSGNYECVSEVMINNDPENPSLASGGVSPLYLSGKCSRASWSEMPKVWQNVFRSWLNIEPEECRGFWRMHELNGVLERMADKDRKEALWE